MILPATVLLLVAPPPVLVATLGSPSHAIREAATRELHIRLGLDADVRWLLYAGLESTDPEVRWRCRAVLRRRWGCAKCESRGGRWCEADWSGPSRWVPCKECEGWGVEGWIRREIRGEPRVTNR